MLSKALPLTTTVTGDGNLYRLRADQINWDSRKSTGCICDSSWSVGLEANQTQQPEFFGVSCEFRHCPTGDDPTTLGIDETDCYGKSMTGGDELGKVGNKCHYDCSGRGICNYETGSCKCFKGYYGTNCGILDY